MAAAPRAPAGARWPGEGARWPGAGARWPGAGVRWPCSCGSPVPLRCLPLTPGPRPAWPGVWRGGGGLAGHLDEVGGDEVDPGLARPQGRRPLPVKLEHVVHPCRGHGQSTRWSQPLLVTFPKCVIVEERGPLRGVWVPAAVSTDMLATLSRGRIRPGSSTWGGTMGQQAQ